MKKAINNKTQQPTKLLNGGVQNVLPAPKDVKNVNKVAKFMASIIRYNRSQWKSELEDLMNARAMALNVDNPRRYFLAQIYKDVLTLDMFFQGEIRIRENRIANKKFKIVNAKGEEQKDKVQQLQTRWFKKFLRYSVDSKFYGFVLPYLYINERGQMDCKIVYPENVVPEKSLLLKNPFDIDGFNFNEEPLRSICIPMGDTDDLGLLLALSIGYILKKHSWQSWDEFEELFGIPVRIAKTASEDKAVQDEILAWLEDMGSAAYGLFPMDTEIEIKESKQTDAYQVFNEKRKAVNQEAAILINGNAESTTAQGSRAKSETMVKSTTDQITEDDKGDAADYVNNDLIPLLIGLGFNFAEGDRFEWDDAEQLTISTMADILVKVSQMGFKLNQKDVETKLGVKIDGEKEAIIPDPKKPNGEDDEEEDDDEDKNKNKAENTFKKLFAMHNAINDLMTGHEHNHA